MEWKNKFQNVELKSFIGPFNLENLYLPLVSLILLCVKFVLNGMSGSRYLYKNTFIDGRIFIQTALYK